MKGFHTYAALGLAGVMALSQTAPAFATPVFSRTQEEWAKLKDNVLEYGEIPGLINEYNVTVRNNRIDYNENSRKDSSDVADDYRDAAQEVYDNIVYPDDPDSPTYASMMASVRQNEATARSLEKQADENVEDSKIYYYQYSQVEDTLAAAAQTNMIAYHQNLLQLELAQKNVALQELLYKSAQTKAGLGMATQMDVLTAEEALQTAQAEVLAAEKTIQSTKQTLLVMTGWPYNGNPEIKELPVVDRSWITGRNLEEDKQTALQNNYALLIDERKLTNSFSNSTQETLAQTIGNEKQAIGSDVTTKYQALLQASADCDQAAAEWDIELQNLDVLNKKYQLGTVSLLEYQTQEYTTASKELNCQLKEMALLQAWENYQWALNGLASAQ